MELICASADVLAAVDDPWGWLTEAERARGQGLLRDVDRRDFAAAHLLVRQAVGRSAGVDPRGVLITQTCAECGGPHGRPQAPRHPYLHASLSHSSGWVAACAGPRPCGVDVENVASLRRVGVVQSALTPVDQQWVERSADPVLAFARLWVRKEALLKAGAVGHAGLPDVQLSCGDELVSSWRGHDLTELDGPEGADVVAATAVRFGPDSCHA